MAQPVYSTWPEAAYALRLTKATKWQAPRNAAGLLCDYALIRGGVANEIACSERDLASHLYTSRRSSSAARRLLVELVRRRVLRIVGPGGGTAPTVFRPWHWTAWDVPWAIDREQAFDRIATFAVLEVRAVPGFSALITMRALTRSARAFSQDVSELARSCMDERASSSIVIHPTSSQPRNERARPATPPRLTVSLKRDKSLSIDQQRGEEEAENRLRPLIEAFKRGCGIPFLVRRFETHLSDLATDADGHLDELIARAGAPEGPRLIEERLAWLKVPLTRDLQSPPQAKSPLRRRLEADIGAFEISGEGECEEARAMRDRLATLGP